MAIRIVVSDGDADHAAAVKAAISLGYGSDISAEIEVRLEGGDTSLAYAASIGAPMVVRSTTFLKAHIPYAEDVYPDVLMVMPYGSNFHVDGSWYLDHLDLIVSTGAGDDACETLYGAGLEFFDEDPIVIEPDQASFSNGYIAGKLLKIKDQRAGSWWDARYAARQTASKNGIWDLLDGYGKIDVAAAVAFSGSLPADPYPIPGPPPPASLYLIGPAHITMTLIAVVNPVRGYATHRCLLTQAGTADPTSVVLENSLNGVLIWSRASSGIYEAALSGAFTEKTLLSPPNLVKVDANIIRLTVSGDDFANYPIEIKVYP